MAATMCLRALPDGLLAIPLYGATERRGQCPKLLVRAPPNGVMFCGGELQGSGRMARPSEIDHADVLMRGADPVDVKKPGRQQRTGARFGRGRPFAEQFHVKPAFFARFAPGCLFWIFVKLDMPAQRQPLAQRPMVYE